MKKTRVIAVLLSVFLVMGLFSISVLAKSVTLRYGLWGRNQLPAMEEIIKEFQEIHPNINVKIELTPFKQYWTKLETAAIGGTLSDVFWMNGPNFIKYAANGILLPITDFINKDNIVLGNYPQSLVDLYTFEGVNYALPKDFDTIGLWFNKELFDAAGISYPDESWDWAQLIDSAQKLTDPAAGVWGIAAVLEDQAGYYNTIYQAGGYIISEDKKSSGHNQSEAIAGLKFWTDLIHLYKVSPTLAQMTDTSAINMFESGKVAMLYHGSWNQIRFANNEYTRDRVDVAVLPKGKERAVVIHGLGNVIAANTKHPEEAWKFLKFLGSKRAAEIQANTGTVIPAFNGTQNAWVQANPYFNLQVFIDMVDYSKPYPISKDSGKWVELETKYFRRAWAGQIRIEDAVKEVAQGMNQYLAQE